MKRIVLYVSFLLGGLMACFEAASQTLVFKQALFLGTNTSSNVLLGTVPSNRVWKITASGTESTYNTACGFSFNGTNTAYYVGTFGTYNNSYVFHGDISDIWLPAGTPVYAMNCSSNYRWVSVLEFEVVP